MVIVVKSELWPFLTSPCVGCPIGNASVRGLGHCTNLHVMGPTFRPLSEQLYWSPKAPQGPSKQKQPPEKGRMLEAKNAALVLGVTAVAMPSSGHCQVHPAPNTTTDHIQEVPKKHQQQHIPQPPPLPAILGHLVCKHVGRQ